MNNPYAYSWIGTWYILRQKTQKTTRNPRRFLQTEDCMWNK